jgi:lambda family phage portal protein
MVQAGEALIVRRRVRPNARNPVGLRLLVIEGQCLDHTLTGAAGRNWIEQGVERDADGRPVAYHIRRHDDGLALRSLGPAERVAAEDVIHLFRRRRPGQLRDVSWLAPILWSLRDLTDYESALLRKAHVEACLAVVVSGEDGALVSGKTPEEAGLLRDAAGRPVESIEPQMILYRDGGGSVDPIVPSGGGDHAGYAKRLLEGAAVGVGLTYDQVAGDMTQANYSSLRAGKVEFRRLLEQIQYALLVPVLCQRVAEWFWEAGVETALFGGRMPAVRHVPPAPEMVDPGKDGAALLRLVRAGFLSPQEVAGMLGSDHATVLRDIAAANALADELGLILDSDPRRTGAAGSAQSAAQNAAIEIAATGAAFEGSDE